MHAWSFFINKSSLKIERIACKSLSTDDKCLIDTFIDGHNGLVFHYTDFNIIAAKYYKSDLEYWLAYKQDELVGIMPVHLKINGRLKRYESGITNFEIPYGGWVFLEDLSNWKIIADLPIGSSESVSITTSFFDKDILYKIGDNRLKETVLINMQNSTLDEIWKNINDKRKNKIRKAEKNSLIIKTSDNLVDFYELLIGMNRRTSMHSKPREFYHDIEKCYGDEHSRILTAYFEKKPIAAIMITGNINAWHYWQGAVDTNYNVGAGEMLQWQAINYVFGKTKCYDMCVIEKQKLPNLAQFKQGFGGALANYNIINKSSLSLRILRKLTSKFKFRDKR